MLSLDDERAGQLLASVAEDRRGECWWLVRRDGTPIPGNGGGGVALLSELRLTRPLGRVLVAARLAGAVDALDRVVSRHLKRLGKLVPAGPAPHRYP